MPTIMRKGPYRFFFYANDRGEPPHVHIERDDNKAKFWLDPVRFETSCGFSRNEINRLQNIITDCQTDLMEEWNAYFSD